MKRVLAVDDTITFRIMLAQIASKQGGHQVIEAADGKEALEKLRANEVDIVITDLNMPVMDGLDFIENGAWRRSVPTDVASHDGGRRAFEAAGS